MRLRAFLAALVLLSTALAPASAHARSKVPPAQVWVTVEAGLGEPAYWAAAFFNGYSKTKLACHHAMSGTKPTPQCDNTPCPSSSYCLRIRFGAFTDDSMNARYSAMGCAGGCVRSGLIEVNADGPLWGGVNGWGAPEKAMVVQHHIGRYAGLPVSTSCVTVMYPSFVCPGGGLTPHALTTAEAAHMAGW